MKSKKSSEVRLVQGVGDEDLAAVRGAGVARIAADSCRPGSPPSPIPLPYPNLP